MKVKSGKLKEILEDKNISQQEMMIVRSVKGTIEKKVAKLLQEKQKFEDKKIIEDGMAFSHEEKITTMNGNVGITVESKTPTRWVAVKEYARKISGIDEARRSRRFCKTEIAPSRLSLRAPNSSDIRSLIFGDKTKSSMMRVINL